MHVLIHAFQFHKWIFILYLPTTERDVVVCKHNRDRRQQLYQLVRKNHLRKAEEWRKQWARCNRGVRYKSMEIVKVLLARKWIAWEDGLHRDTTEKMLRLVINSAAVQSIILSDRSSIKGRRTFISLVLLLTLSTINIIAHITLKTNYYRGKGHANFYKPTRFPPGLSKGSWSWM